jgi:hypothetical protein
VGAADTSGTFLQRFTTVHYGARGRALAEAIERVGRQDFEAELGDARIGEREPVPVLRLNAWLADCRALEQEMTRARAQIASERPRWNRDELDYLDLAARRVVHVARREQMLHDVAGLDLPSVNTRSRRARRLERDLRALSEESAAIEVRFEELWRERYEAGGLKAGLAPLERQAAGLDSVWSRTFPGAAPVAKSRYVKPATPLPRLTPSELRRLAAERAKQSTLELSLGY